jgi:hypothetical protein
VHDADLRALGAGRADRLGVRFSHIENSAGKLHVAGRVIAVAVGIDDRDLAFDQRGDKAPQIVRAVAGIDQQRARTSVNQIHADGAVLDRPDAIHDRNYIISHTCSFLRRQNIDNRRGAAACRKTSSINVS